jgi:hypothetical protein
MSVNTLNQSIQCNMLLHEVIDPNYYITPASYLDIAEHIDNRYSLKIKNNDGSDFITWEGPFRFQQ